MKDGEISLTERFAQKQYVYPRRIYEGMEFFIDIDTLTAQSVWVQGEFDINFHKVVDRFCLMVLPTFHLPPPKSKKY